MEWAHAIAPQANIILFEASSTSFTDLLAAVQTAATRSGVSVVSMSWGGAEFSGETSYDSYFTTPTVTRTSPFWHPRAIAVRPAGIRPFRPTSSPSAAPA